VQPQNNANGWLASLVAELGIKPNEIDHAAVALNPILDRARELATETGYVEVDTLMALAQEVVEQSRFEPARVYLKTIKRGSREQQERSFMAIVAEAAAVVTRSTLGGVSLDEIKDRPVKWLWPGYIPRGKFTLLEGEPDRGKSLLVCDLTARIVQGRGFPGGAPCPHGHVWIFSAEDDPADTIKPRLRAAGLADKDFRCVKIFDSESQLVIPDDLPRIAERAKAERVDVIFFDALEDFQNPARGTNSSLHMRQMIAELKQAAELAQMTVIGMRHLNKNDKASAVNRGSGSIAITAAARASFVVGFHPDDAGLEKPHRRHVLAHVKANNADAPASLAFKIEVVKVTLDSGDKTEMPRLVWEKEPCEVSANELSGRPIKAPAEKPRERAKHFLQVTLSEGPVEATVIKKLARARGIKEDVLEAAKADLGLRSHRKGFGKGSTSFWCGKGVWKLAN
jgi:putative DNA primase/helicase